MARWTWLATVLTEQGFWNPAGISMWNEFSCGNMTQLIFHNDLTVYQIVERREITTHRRGQMFVVYGVLQIPFTLILTLRRLPSVRIRELQPLRCCELVRATSEVVQHPEERSRPTRGGSSQHGLQNVPIVERLVWEIPN